MSYCMTRDCEQLNKPLSPEQAKAHFHNFPDHVRWYQDRTKKEQDMEEMENGL